MKQKSSETRRGKETGEALLKSATRQEERKTEARKGSDLAKGPARFEERSKSSDGKSAGSKQH
jgi:hypothetical protein